MALFLPAVLAATATVLNVLLGAEPPPAAEINAWTGLFSIFAIVLLIPGFGGAWEEPGWRGYAFPRLQNRRSALVASLILGALIAAWHLPLMVAGQVHYSDIVLIFAGTIVYNWVFNNARGSVLIIMVMHAANNTVSGSFFSPDVFGGRLNSPVLATGLGVERRGDLGDRHHRSGALLTQVPQAGGTTSRRGTSPKQGRNVIMSSKVKWGGIAGLVAAVLLIISGVLNQMSPVQRTYDSTANYLYLGVTVAAYIAVIGTFGMAGWAGVLLIVAFPLGDVANAIFSSAENLLLALLWGSMGVALLSRRQGVAESVATQRAGTG